MRIPLDFDKLKKKSTGNFPRMRNEELGAGIPAWQREV
jgi:hypothetical protein